MEEKLMTDRKNATEKLYYKDGYMKEFTAEVVSCEKEKKGYRVVLDRTAFFPEGGGQFGVGFYSAFMAANKIDVFTRKAGADGKIWHWSSDGTNSYDIGEVACDSDVAKKYGFDDVTKSGSAIEMHLNDDSKEFASRWKIEELIKKCIV